MGRQRVAEESRAAVLPHARQRRRWKAATRASSTKCRSSTRRRPKPTSRPAACASCRARSPQGLVHRAECGADAELREHRRLRRQRHDGRTRGSPSDPARRSARTCTSPAASASAACSSRCRLRPTIIEDDCFIGARSEVVEGVIVEQGAVLSMGVFIGQGTRIYDRATGKVYRGRVPAGSVVVPGTLPSEDGKIRAVLRHHRETGGRADSQQDVDQRVAARGLTGCASSRD